MDSPHTDVFVVEDSPGIRKQLVDMLAQIDGVRVVGQASTPVDAVTGILREHPDCVLLDYQLIGGTGVDVLRAVHPKAPDIVFIVLTNHATPQYRRLCMDAGASFFFDKTNEFARVGEVINARAPSPGCNRPH